MAKLRVGKGDPLYAVELPDGIKLKPYGQEFERQRKAAEDIMRTR